MKQAVLRFLRDEEGATAIEYGLIAGLISVVLIGVLSSVEGGLSGVFDTIAKKLEKVSTPAPQ